MVIIYHFANPDIVNIIRLIAFILLVYAGYNLRKKNEDIKSPNLFLVSGFVGIVWYIVFFFIPAYMFTTLPTPAEIQFTNIYSFVLHSLVPTLILIAILGIIIIIIGVKNKENYGLWLLVSGILFITYISLDLVPAISDLIDLILSITIFIGIVLSSGAFLYFSIKFKSYYLIIFNVLFLLSLVFPAIGVNLYIPIY
ncbi:MAG: hypothetical protein ACFFDF_00530 [Candidatus Odinarchaeota archaeon]